MKALVTGATGFLGSHLTRRLVRDGHEVTILRRSGSNVAGLKDLDFNDVIGDITDPEAVSRAVQGNEMVFHTAAHLAHWDFQRADQERVNVQGTKNIVESCHRHGVRRLLHVSSVATIGIPQRNRGPATEDFEFNLEGSPLPYHISKKRAEENVLAAVENGLDAVVVNPSAFWGPFGEIFRGGAFPLMVREMPIVPYFKGGMCVAHVQDVVEGVVAAAEKGETGQRYILGGENLPYRSILQMSARKLNLRRQFVPIPNVVCGAAAMILEPLGRLTKRRPRITYAVHYCSSRFSYYDSSKAQRKLGYAPRGFKAILDECVAFTISRENGKVD